MKREKVHYNIDAIDSLGASINLIYGERSNGKSYQVKHKKAVVQYLNGGDRYICNYQNPLEIIKEKIKNGNRFILMRRLTEEVKSDKIEKYKKRNGF